LQRSPRQYLTAVNRFTLQMASTAEVEQAHREFTAKGKKIGIADLGKLDSAGGQANFIFSDVDKNWWELTSGT